MGAINVADILTIQDLANGQLDVKALGEAANGDENTIVTTRTGETYPSAKKAIKTLFENGGLPAIAFETFADMITTGVTEGAYAVVTNDVFDKNGIYRKTDGVTVKQAYSATTNADLFLDTSNDEDLVQYADLDGAIFAKFNAKGELSLVDIDGTVQGVLNEHGDKIESTDSLLSKDSNGFALIVADNFDKTAFGIKNTGEVVSADKPLSISRPHYINTNVSYYPCQSQHQKKAPMPLNSAPMSYSLPADFLDLKVAEPANHVPIDTIYRNNDGVVHPYIAEFADGLNGSRYWLGITPYYDSIDTYENPFIYTSDDLQSFKLLGTALADRPFFESGIKKYNSDIFITYDHHTAEILVCWRYTYRGASSYNQIWCRRTRDGFNFKPKELLYTSNENILSPSIIYDFDAKIYLMFTIDALLAGGTGIVRHQTKNLGGAWTNRVESALTNKPVDAVLWHLEVKYVGDKIVCVANDYTVTNNSYLGVSSDKGLSFNMGTGLITGTHQPPYKTSINPIYQDGQMALQVVWTNTFASDLVENRWKLYSATTQFITITEA